MQTTLSRPLEATQLPTHDVLRQAVMKALTATGYRVLRTVQIHIHEGLVCLHGCVPNYYMKQLATAAALSISGVLELRNELSVMPPQLPSRDLECDAR